MQKSELDPKQVFDFIGYQFNLNEVKVRPTLEYWQTLNAKIQKLLSRPTCLVWQLMSLMGLLTATAKQVHQGHLHMSPIQWNLKNNWRVPESLEKVIPIPRSLHPWLRWLSKLQKISCLSGPERVPRHLLEPYNAHSHRQHYSGWL